MPEEEKTETVPMQTMPALALRGLTVYPKMMVHFDVGREASVKAIEESMSSNQPIFLVAQKDIRVEEPDRNHLFAMGTVSVVRQILRLPGKTIRVMVEGQTRARLHELTQTDPYLVAQVEPVETSEHYEGKTNSLRAEAAIRQAYELFDRYSELSPKNASAEMLMNIMSSEDAGYIADFLAQNVSMRVLDKQSILDELRPVQRLNKMNRLLRREVEILEMEQSIQRRVQENMTQNQKDAFLREQVRVIQEELGEDGDNELAAYRRQIADAKLPEEVETKLLKEVMHLEKQPFGSAEASVLRNYLDVCLELPWTKTSKERVNVQAARKILDADHFGLEKVKERILEFLAVKQLAPDLKGQILCLVGPPGVGKTTLAQIIANKLETPFYTLSAVTSGVKDVRDVIERAKSNRFFSQASPILFIDEIHRFSKSQQDSLLGAVEQGTVTLIGATTENPSFEVIRPLLSRCQLYTLKSLEKDDLLELLQRAITTDTVLKERKIELKETTAMLRFSGGDARKLLNILELVIDSEATDPVLITDDMVTERLQQNPLAYDKDGEMHYDIISAFIKSIRGSDPDGAIYWLARMGEGGEDPAFIARRLVISASEDIGLANPNALLLANACFDTLMKVGWPEGRIPLAEATIYLATSPKSNSAYMAINNALELVR